MNLNSSIGLTEELFTNLINTVAMEYHFRITLEKYHSLLYVKNVEDKESRGYLSKKLDFVRKQLEAVTAQRREVMSIIQSLGTEDSNQDMWCLFKHSAIAMITAFEAWQVDLDNERVEAYYHKAVELFNVTASEFLGFVPQPCSACFADMVGEQEELNYLTKDFSNEETDNEKLETFLEEADKVFRGDNEFVQSDKKESR